MARVPTGNRNQTIHCDICGEDYAATYKRCPFCHEHEVEARNTSAPRKGRRASTNRRGGGYSSGSSPRKVFVTILSLAFIVAAICIVVPFIKTMIDKGNTTPPVSGSPAVSPSSVVTPSATPSGPVVPADQTATGLALDASDFTMSSYGETHAIKATFTPAGSKGYVEWTSSNPEVVSVDENGTAKAIGKVGSVSRATITATLKGTQISQSCIVRCNFDAPAGSATSTPPSSSGTAKLSSTDFTMPAGSSVQISVSGTTATPTWKISDTSVATVSDTGLVTMVGRGNATLICTVDGQELTCIVRCS